MRSNQASKVLFTFVKRHLCFIFITDVLIQISHVSDDHVPSLSSSGPWKIGSVHRARVTGHFLFDGLLQLSLKRSVLEQKFLKTSDVEVGEVVKGTIKRLTEAGLFVSISGNIDGVVWPNHYADISLKQPAKRFKPGASIKCRVRCIAKSASPLIIEALCRCLWWTLIATGSL